MTRRHLKNPIFYKESCKSKPVRKGKVIQIIREISANRFLQHMLFWAFSFYALLYFFVNHQKITSIDYLYTFLFHFTLILGVYVNLNVLIPVFLRSGKYLKYLVWVTFTVIVCTQFNIFFFAYAVDYIFPGYYFISYYDFFDIILFFVVYLGLTTLLKFSKAWFQLADSEKKLSQAMREKLDAELNALKAQINPHFLFNSLNNLYGLALHDHKKAATFILKLSDIIRYMIYEVNEDFVSLKKELEFIENYVELQKLRSGSEAKISLVVVGNINDQQIAPLLFIPFIENSFKYGIQGNIGATFVYIRIEVIEKDLTLKVENKKGDYEQVEKQQVGGIGLRNVRKRLHLIYPGKHTLLIEDKDQYAVTLNLKI